MRLVIWMPRIAELYSYHIADMRCKTRRMKDLGTTCMLNRKYCMQAHLHCSLCAGVPISQCFQGRQQPARYPG